MTTPVRIPHDLIGPYRRVLATPGARAFVLAGWLARVPLSAAGLGTVLLISGTTGSFTLAGLAAAAVNLTGALAQPLWARVADRRGQGRVLRTVVPAQLLAAVSLVLVVTAEAPRWSWLLAAASVGATSLNVGAMVRSRWSHAVPDPEQRLTAYALEGVLEEFVFVVGPPLITLAAALVHPTAGFLVGLLVGGAGALVLAAQRASEPPITPTAIPSSTGETRQRPGRALVAVVSGAAAGVGVVFGGFDVATVALAGQQGTPAVAGIALAAFAAGSLLSGLAYGIAPAPRNLARRYIGCVVVFAVAVQALLVVHSLPVLVVVAFLASLTIAPVLIAGPSLIESRVEVSALNEALTWPGAALALGLTARAAAAGPVVDTWGASAGFIVPAGGALLAGFVALAALPTARRRPPQ